MEPHERYSIRATPAMLARLREAMTGERPPLRDPHLVDGQLAHELKSPWALRCLKGCATKLARMKCDHQDGLAVVTYTCLDCGGPMEVLSA